MSDLTPIGNPDKDLSIEELAKYQPKRVDETKRSNKPMSKLEWYEIVQWLQLRKADAATWEEVYIESWYSDLANYTKNDVFYAVKSLYDEGRSKAPDGSMILARLKELAIPTVKINPTQFALQPGGMCKNYENYVCAYNDKRWVSDKYGNQHFKMACMADGDHGYCENLIDAVPDENELRMKPERPTKASLYPTMMTLNLDLNMKKQVWKRFEHYEEGDLEGAIAEYGKGEFL